MRPENWLDLLSDVIAKHEALPFQYGVSDCATLPFDVIEALTGELPEQLRGLQGQYHDIESTIPLLRDRGCRNLGELFAKALPEVPLAFANRGDVGIANYRGAIAGGGVVIVGVDLIGKGIDGTVRLPRSHLSRAFKVG